MSKFEKQLTESFSGLGKVTGKNRWKVTILRTGKGSTGNYTEAALETGPLAFPVGTKVNLDHATSEEKWERPAGSVRTLAGAIVETPVIEGNELNTVLEFSEEAAPLIEQFHAILGVSLKASGWGDDYDETGLPIVEGFIPSPLNTVDVVTVAGAGGKFISLVEEYVKKTDILNLNEELSTGRNNGMTPDEIKALFASFKDELLTALKPEPTETEAPAVSAISEALIAADLPKSARDKVYSAVNAGAKLEEAIAAEQAYIKELSEAFDAKTKKDLEEAAQGTLGGAGSYDYTVGNWG